MWRQWIFVYQIMELVFIIEVSKWVISVCKSKRTMSLKAKSTSLFKKSLSFFQEQVISLCQISQDKNDL